MSASGELVTEQRLSMAIDRGLESLGGRQAIDGSFTTLAGPDEDLERSGRPDPTPFTTAIVVTALQLVPDEQAAAIVQRAVRSLEAERLAIGVWKFWTRSHPGASFIPPDTDDTACCVRAIRHGSPDSAYGESLVLGNRSATGLFYTWILPHYRHLGMPSTWASLAWIVSSPFKLRRWFRSGSAPPRWNDKDLVVNVNVLAVLGDRAETRAAAKWITDVVRDGRESISDRWYQSDLAAWHAILRCVEGGVESLDAARPYIVARLSDACGPESAKRMTPLDAARAASVLCAWAPTARCVERVVVRVLENQRADGSWPTCAQYFDDYSRKRVWGSSEATTALCIEALARARAVLRS